MPLTRRFRYFINAQAFLVDAEYVIRIRGLPKPQKSVKVRSLHHVYTYIRIMAESTCGCALLNICPDCPSSSLLSMESSPISLRSFRVAHDSLDDEVDLTLEKSDKVGHDDIHLEVMGQWKDTLYPESLMALLSQTIHLANEQELLHRGPSLDTRVLGNLQKRASLLERYVLSWEPPPSSLSFLTSDFFAEDAMTLKMYLNWEGCRGLLTKLAAYCDGKICLRHLIGQP